MADTRLYVIEVKLEHRQGRGRYWRPDSCGYTDDVAQAGLYTRDEAVRRCRGTAEHRAVPAERRLRPAMKEAQARAEALRASLKQAGTLRRRREMDFETAADLAERRRKKRGILSPYEQHVEDERRRVDQFNARHPVGTAVRYWTGLREGDGVVGQTRSRAQMNCDHAVVWVTGHAACIALTHVEPIGGPA